MNINRYNFSQAAVKRAIKGNILPNFMKEHNFKVKDGTLVLNGKVVIPNEERGQYLRKILYKSGSTAPLGRDSLYHYVKTLPVINISKRDIEKFLKSQNVIVTRSARPKQEKRQFYSTVKKAGICSGDLAHIRPQDMPSMDYMPSRQDDDPDTEWKPGVSMKNIWKSGTSGDRYFYNLVDIYTGWLETEVVGTKLETVIAKATKRLVARMAKALGTPVREIQYDFGTEFNLSEKNLEKKKIRVRRMRTNAVVEQTNAKMQRIFYTIVAQKRTGFKGSVEQAVAISNNTKNRRLGMTPKEAVAKLRGGEQPVKKTPNRVSQKNRAYPVGTIVRALTTQRAKVKPGYKAYKGKHYTAPKKVTSVSFYQGYPKYTLDNVKHSKEKKTDPLLEKLEALRKKVPQDKPKIKALVEQIKRIRRSASSKLLWHDQLVPVGSVDERSRSLVKLRDHTYKKGDNVWYHFKGKKLVAKVKKREAGKWRLNYQWTSGKFYTTLADEGAFEPRV